MPANTPMGQASILSSHFSGTFPMVPSGNPLSHTPTRNSLFFDQKGGSAWALMVSRL
jgi:hypothetical protein